MEVQCPVCHQSIELHGGSAHCEYCQQDIAFQALCPDCHQPLQVLKACGAVDYFCQNGHGLISKKRIEFLPFNII
ncbi:hypothetical protein TRECRb50_12730 [Escherichia coli]|uniref:zinc ribbon domain-containing protein n=1 Tax=Escherichia coli TaxID=562 RepID=UPI0010CB648D|nr:zinc ribbon domain-containing protein [Escherichia coli]MBS8585446.1 zinc ribbon domain-containing protein [Escherichia coli]BDH32457.1 hypothetical protein TRECRb50_12730 [Escherichia coli]GDA56011.1 hypothetical protein HmCmsJML164_04181 [Escherichia coli]